MVLGIGKVLQEQVISIRTLNRPQRSLSLSFGCCGSKILTGTLSGVYESGKNGPAKKRNYMVPDRAKTINIEPENKYKDINYKSLTLSFGYCGNKILTSFLSDIGIGGKRTRQKTEPYGSGQWKNPIEIENKYKVIDYKILTSSFGYYGSKY